MKALRILLLLGLGLVLVTATLDYFRAQEAQTASATFEPAAIPSNLDSRARAWRWSQYTSDKRRVELEAGAFEQVSGSTAVDLGGVELNIFDEDGRSFDRIICESAQFDAATGKMYSEGEVTVLIGIPVDTVERAKVTPTVIRSSGVTFDSSEATAVTDRYTEYVFDGGSGHSTGASYHSGHGTFHMKSDVYLERDPTSPNTPKLIIRAGELFYYERDQRVDMLHWAELERGSQRLRAGQTHVFLNKGFIQRLEAADAEGLEERGDRKVRFKTPRLSAFYNDRQAVEKVIGEGRTELTSVTPRDSTRAVGNRIEMVYVTPDGASDSELRQALLDGDSVIEIGPKGTNSQGLRRVRAEKLALAMRAGGAEIELLETLTPGRLEIIPGSAGQRRRDLDAERIRAGFDERSRMKDLAANGKVHVVNHPAQSGGKDAVKLETWSDALKADLDPETGELVSLVQWADFRFEEGSRLGSAQSANFDPKRNRIELTDRSEVIDPSGTIRAHRILLEQTSDRLEAETGVRATYRSIDDAKTGKDGAPRVDFFSDSEPLYATSDRLVSDQAKGLVRLEGKARLWQSAHRVEAESIAIDRQKGTLEASRNVLSILTEEASGTETKQAPQRVTIRAGWLRYEEGANRAVYREGVDLRRGNLEVRGDELVAELTPREDQEGSSGGSLREAVAKGEVRIRELGSDAAAARQGFAERARYLPSQELVYLEGAPARLLHPERGETRGSELTYRTDDDSLLVSGKEAERSYSYRRKAKP